MDNQRIDTLGASVIAEVNPHALRHHVRLGHLPATKVKYGAYEFRISDVMEFKKQRGAGKFGVGRPRKPGVVK
jgi:hypothetical protein